MTLITQRSGGKRRRCDSRCYDAKTSKCACVCDGMNHSKGLTQAAINTRKAGLGIIGQQMELELPGTRRRSRQYETDRVS